MRRNVTSQICHFSFIELSGKQKNKKIFLSSVYYHNNNNNNECYEILKFEKGITHIIA